MAAEWSRFLKPGGLVLLEGPLAAGKTTFVQAVADSLGVEDVVTSPTFALVHEYRGPLPIFHMDLYRLSGEEEFDLIGGWEYLNRGGICFVEWPSRLGTAWPVPHWSVTIQLNAASRRYRLEEILA